MIIYKITCLVNNKVYIGQTIKTIKDRWNRHIWNCTLEKEKMAITKAIKKYGVINFKIEEIDRASNIEELNHKEQYYISFYDSISPKGYNIDSGGKNKTMSEETKKKISISNTGKKASSETIKKLSESHRGHKMSEETKKKLSEINKLKKIDKKVREAASLKNSKIYILEKNDVLYIISNMKNFAKKFNYCKSNLSELVRGKKEVYRGFKLVKDLGFVRDIENIEETIKSYSSIYKTIIYL